MTSPPFSLPQYLLLVVLCLLGCISNAANAESSVRPVLLNAPPVVEVLDSDQPPTELQDILRTGLGWKVYPDTHINMGFVEHPIWIRFSVPSSPIPDTFLIEFANTKISQIDLYITEDDSTLPSTSIPFKPIFMQLMEEKPLSQRYLPVSQFVFPIPVKPEQQLTVYAKITNSYPMKLPIYLWDEQTFTQEQIHRTMFNGIYFGSVLIMALYNLCLFFFVKDRSYANYVIFIVLLATFIVIDKGIAIDYLWQNNPETSQRFYTTILAMGALSSVRFTTSFLSLKQNAPRLNSGLQILSLCWLSLLVTSLLSSSSIVLVLCFLLLLPGGAALLLCGIYMWRQGLPEASFYTIAWITLVHAVVAYSASSLGLIPYSPLLDDFIQASNILEAALLSLGLAYRINTLNYEKQKAYTSVKAKSDLLATMSHEIRTPMNGILGMAQLLKDTTLTSQQKHYIKTILGSGQTLLTVLNDILDHSKIEAGRLDVESISFNIRQAIDDTAAIFATRAADKMLYFNIYMEPDIPLTLESDPTRVKQVLTNLLSNAFKFTDKGSIIVNVSIQHNIKGERAELLIEVIDQGIGIPAIKQQHLFEHFSQADTSTSRIYGGTGLGLSISKRLVEMMGGAIGVSSEIDKGSTFWFSLPITNSTNYQLPNDETLANSLSALSALVVSNTDRFVNSIRQHTDIWQMQLFHASTIEEVPFVISDCDKAVDFVLVEVNHRLSNYQDVAAIINSNDLLQDAQLIISAPAGSSDSNIGNLSIGKAPWLIEHPFSINRLFYLVFNSLIQHTEKVSMIDVNRPFSHRHGLVVDDNAVNRQVALAFLNKLGVNAIAVSSGQEAFDCISKEENPIDFILMDCEMPVVDGFQATRMIREWEIKQHKSTLPIIALSAHAMESHKSACTEAGMDDFVAKPVIFDDLRKTLSLYLS